MCVELSQPSTTAQRAHISSPLLYHPTFEEVQLEVSRSIQVSRSPGCCFHTKWVARCAEQAGTLAPPRVKTATNAVLQRCD